SSGCPAWPPCPPTDVGRRSAGPGLGPHDVSGQAEVGAHELLGQLGFAVEDGAADRGTEQGRTVVIVVISEHWTSPDRMEAAEERIDGQGARMRDVPGYVFRFRLATDDDPVRI